MCCMGVAGFIGKWIFRIVAPIILIGAIVFFFANGLQDASLERFVLTGIEDIDTNSFTFTGELAVKNPSEVSIPIQSITYDVFLEETNEQIGSGTIPTFTLVKDDVTDIRFAQELEWIPTAQLAAELATKEEVFIRVDGVVVIDLPKVDEHEITFSATQDIKEYIAGFADLPVVGDVGLEETNTILDTTSNEEENQENPLAGILG